MRRKKGKAAQALNRLKLETEIQLIKRQIKHTEAETKQLSWWKKNLLALAAIIISLFSVLGPKAKSAEVYLRHPEEDSQPLDRDDKDDKWDDPPKPVYLLYKQHPIYQGPHKQIDKGTVLILLEIMKVLEQSEDPTKTKVQIIEKLKAQKEQHKILIDARFIDQIIKELEEVQPNV